MERLSVGPIDIGVIERIGEVNGPVGIDQGASGLSCAVLLASGGNCQKNPGGREIRQDGTGNSHGLTSITILGGSTARCSRVGASPDQRNCVAAWPFLPRPQRDGPGSRPWLDGGFNFAVRRSEEHT